VIINALSFPREVQEAIAHWKERFDQVYGLDIELEEGIGQAIFRALSKREYDLLQLEANDAERIEKVLDLALLYPDSITLDSWVAGAIQHIHDSILKVSAWDAENLMATMEAAEIYASSLHGAMVSFICEGFPAYTPDDLDDMSATRFSKLLKQAEWRLQRPFEFDRWLDPKGWIKRNRGRMRAVKGGGNQPIEIPAGMRVDPEAAARAMHGERTAADILGDPNAVKIDPTDPNSIRKLVQEQRQMMR
jgi:hypothetical protein